MAAARKIFRACVIQNVQHNALHSSTCAATSVSRANGATKTLHSQLRSFPIRREHRVVVDRCKIPFLLDSWHHFSSGRKGPSGTDEKDVNTSSEGRNDEKDVNTSSEDETDLGDDSDGWEDDDETTPEYGDGGAGGGVVLQNVPWGERVLSIAREVLHQFGDDMELYAFKTTPRGYIYVRLDKLSNVYGCPDIEELEKYNQEYKKKLDEIGESGDIPHDLAVEVSSPGAERLLKVPDDLNRFKDLPMRVYYVEDESTWVKESVFLLENIDTESGTCEWKLADVKANRNMTGKGRPLSRKLKDWRLKLDYAKFKKVSLYLES